MISTSGTTQTSRVRKDRLFAKVSLNKSSGQKALKSNLHYSPGDLICHFRAGTTQSYATYLTIQIGADKHITLLPDFLQYTNHSCDPNVFFNTTTMELVCIKAIEPGDEMTFFYPGTEWEMAQPFICNCGKTGCLQLINGASHLSIDTLQKYKLTDFIRQMIRQKLSL